MHLKLVARIENIMLARRCQLWSLAVNVDLFDNSKAFFSSKRKVHKNQLLFACALLTQPFALNTKRCMIRKKMKELFWNIKLDCRSKQIIMDLVTLRGLIHVYMHVPCLVAPSADQFFFFACLFHSNIWMFANLCQLYGEVEHPEWGSE